MKHLAGPALFLVSCLNAPATLADDGEPFTLVVTGDAIVGQPLSSVEQPGFLELVDILRAADTTITNLEIVLRDGEGYAQAEAGGSWLQAPGHRAEDLAWMGVDLAAHANNHTFDFGVGGVLSTHANMERVGIAMAGSGRDLNAARAPAFYDAGRARVALVSTASTFIDFGMASPPVPGHPGRPGLNPLRVTLRPSVTPHSAQALSEIAKQNGLGFYSDQWGNLEFSGAPLSIGDGRTPRFSVDQNDRATILGQVSRASAQANYVVVSIHAHQLEGQPGPPDFLVEFAHDAIDAGADIFFGHGPHIVHGIEIYRGRPIFYGLGNFVFQAAMERQPWEFHEQWGTDPAERYPQTPGYKVFDERPVYWYSVLPVVTFRGTRLERIELVPLDLQQEAPWQVRGRPLRAHGVAAQEIAVLLREISKPFGTRIDGFGDGPYTIALPGAASP